MLTENAEKFKPKEKSLAVIFSELVGLRWYYTCKLREAIGTEEYEKIDKLHTASVLISETILREEFGGDLAKAFDLGIIKY